MPPYKPLLERFEEKVSPEPNTGCWLWIGGYFACGYGAIGAFGGRRVLYAHRVAWELYRGPVPTGQYVLHRCDVRACANPDHLFLGDHAANMRDMRLKGRGYQKLDQDDLLFVWELLLGGWSQSDVARVFGVTATRINTIQRTGHVGYGRQ